MYDSRFDLYKSIINARPPQDAMDILKVNITDHGEALKLNAGERTLTASFDQRLIYIEYGRVIFSGEDNFIVFNGVAGMIFLGGLMLHTYIESIDNSLIYTCDISELEKSDNINVILAMSKVHHWISKYISLILKPMTLNNAYKKIILAIEWLACMEEDERKKTPIVKFICEHTLVSKAHTHTIIKALKVGGYIQVKSGFLIKINKSLPSEY